MAFTPDERVSEADPAIRVIGHKTSSIVLADEAEYDLSGYTEGTYEIGFTHPDLNPRVGPFKVQISVSSAQSGYNQRAASSTDTDNQTDVIVVSTEYDFDDLELDLVTDAAHNLRVGDWISLAYDSDVDLTQAFGTLGVLSEVDQVGMQVSAVASATTFSVDQPATGFGGSADDAANTALDANLYKDGSGDASYEKVVRDISLFDGAGGTAPVAGATAALCEVAWDGEIFIQDPANDVGARFILDADNPEFSPAGSDPVTPFANVTSPMDASSTDQWTAVGDITPFTNATQGVGIDSGLLFLYNETAATNAYTVTMKNSPVIGRDLDGWACFYSRDNTLRLKNRVGQSLTFSIRRVS